MPHTLRFFLTLLLSVLLPLTANWVASLTLPAVQPYVAIIVLSFCLLSFLQVLSLRHGSSPGAPPRSLPPAFSPLFAVFQTLSFGLRNYFNQLLGTIRRPETAAARSDADLRGAFQFLAGSSLLSLGSDILANPEASSSELFAGLVTFWIVPLVVSVIFLWSWRILRASITFRTVVAATIYVFTAYLLVISVAFAVTSYIVFTFIPVLSMTGTRSINTVIYTLIACDKTGYDRCFFNINGISIQPIDFLFNPVFISALVAISAVVLSQWWFHIRLWIGLKRATRSTSFQGGASFCISWALISCAAVLRFSVVYHGMHFDPQCAALRAPRTPEFNTAPVSFDREGGRCLDEPLIDVEAVSWQGKTSLSTSQAEHNLPVIVDPGARFRVRLYIRNGALNTDASNEIHTTARNVRVSVRISSEGVKHRLSASVVADNAPAISSSEGKYGGDVTVVSTVPVILKYVPQSTRVAVLRSQAYERYGPPSKAAVEEAAGQGHAEYPLYTLSDQIGDGVLNIGDLKAGFVHRTWIFFHLQAVPVGSSDPILPYFSGEEPTLTASRSKDAVIYAPIEIRSRYSLSLITLADEETRRREYQKAIEKLGAALAVQPEERYRAMALHRRANIYYEEKRWNDAIRDYFAAATSYRSDGNEVAEAYATAMVAVVYVYRKEPELARVTWEAARRLYDKHKVRDPWITETERFVLGSTEAAKYDVR